MQTMETQTSLPPSVQNSCPVEAGVVAAEINKISAAHPEYGIKRIHDALKLALKVPISRKRVRKILQQIKAGESFEHVQQDKENIATATNSNPKIETISEENILSDRLRQKTERKTEHMLEEESDEEQDSDFVPDDAEDCESEGENLDEDLEKDISDDLVQIDDAEPSPTEPESSNKDSGNDSETSASELPDKHKRRGSSLVKLLGEQQALREKLKQIQAEREAAIAKEKETLLESAPPSSPGNSEANQGQDDAGVDTQLMAKTEALNQSPMSALPSPPKLAEAEKVEAEVKPKTVEKSQLTHKEQDKEIKHILEEVDINADTVNDIQDSKMGYCCGACIIV
mmetsp:Transcript_1912/g.2723  ORF Transcript_1912/g.2723 Transcript_1912/m.2723 type:complete len:342 (-) Transcript_1912:3943-4968(-)